jgi:hypothetical protein
MPTTTRAIKKGVPPRQHDPKPKRKDKKKKNKKRLVVSSESESESEELEIVEKKRRRIDSAKPIDEVEEVDIDNVDAGTDNEVRILPIVLYEDLPITRVMVSTTTTVETTLKINP